MAPSTYRTEDGYKDWVVLPKGNAGWFYLGRVHNGEIVEMFDLFQMHFDAAGDALGGRHELRAVLRPHRQGVHRAARAGAE